MKVTMNKAGIKQINADIAEALIDTAEAIKTDLVNSRTMPFASGTLQNDSTFVDTRRALKGVATITSDTPYARKVYFHPEFNFRKDDNPNAGGRWFDPYLTGDKKELPIKFFQKAMLRRNGGK